MANGWMVFVVVACIVLCSGLVIASAILRAAWAQKEREALTATDLRALEESAVMLIEQMKSEADRGIAEIDRRASELRDLISEAEKTIAELKSISARSTATVIDSATEIVACRVESPVLDENPDVQQILELASQGFGAAEIARQTGKDCAEVNLVLSLGKLKAN